MKKRYIAISIVVILLIISIALVFYNPKESNMIYNDKEVEQVNK